MRRDDWSRVDQILDAALDKPALERERFVTAACTGEPELLREVRRLLELAERDDERLGRPAGVGDVLGPKGPEDAREDGELAPGERVGSFEILSFLGEGGMGRVYRARDAHLGRFVAIKALSRRFAADASLFRRFQREAKILAKLNHPNIGAIYDVVVDRERPYLVLELVEGETLSDRVASGALPIREVLRIADQLLDGIEAAHAQGVVHRDLKPGNVTVTPEGRVKILDFGLAKPQERASPARVTPSRNPTTESGLVLGTPSYMSPEQARGEAVDERTDLWAFGCLLFELVTGRRAFVGDSPSDVVAAVLRDEPRWDVVPPETPRALLQAMERCLRKPRSERPQGAADVRRLLRAGAQAARRPRARRRARPNRALAFVGAAGLAAGVLAWLAGRPSGPPRLSGPVQLTSTETREDFPAWSPDGRSFAYASQVGNAWDLWVGEPGRDPVNRSLDHDGIDYAPSWSPDGRYLAFRSSRQGGGIFVLGARSGAPRSVAARNDAVDLSSAPQWSSDGASLAYVVLDPRRGAQVEIATLESGETETLTLPLRWNCLCQIAWSPDGRLLAYVDAQNPNAPLTELKLFRRSDAAVFPAGGPEARYWSPSFAAGGRSLYYVSDRAGSLDLWHQPLARDGAPAGEPEPVTTGVGMRHAAVSPGGDRLVYSQGRPVANLFRVPLPAEGRESRWSDTEQLTFDQAYVEFADVSPDGTRVVVSSDRAGNPDLWSLPTSGGEPEQLTDDPTPDWLPAFSPDGRAIAFYAYRSGNRDIWVMPGAGGPARQLTRDPASDASPGWSADGRSIFFYSNRGGGVDLWRVPIEGGAASRLVEDSGTDRFARMSPDGRWLSYASSKDGTTTLWLEPTDGSPRTALVVGDVFYPIWSRASDGLFYTPTRGGGSDLWRVDLDGGRRRLTDLSGRVGRIGRTALATDGRNLYFTWEQDLGDIWVADVVRD